MKTNVVTRFWYPVIKGHEISTSPSYSFLIEHKTKDKTRRLLFDLGLRKDWNNLAPFVLDRFTKGTWILHAEKNVADILEEEVRTSSLDPASKKPCSLDGRKIPRAPSSSQTTGIVVYALNHRNVMLTPRSGRNLREITFDKGLMIGGFNAVDFFGDQSFYLPDAPGSATKPFYVLSIEEGAKNVAHNRTDAEKTIEKIEEFDALSNVFVCIAHDETLLDIIDFYPKDINSWMEKGWAKKSKWAFLADFQEAVKDNGSKEPGTFST
ncbi:hypothetical protein PRZ48_012026 [Zasmidium cellare]|uniref:Penicillin-binding protein transpeptidase domain-containing protein n=1 Tax=Zasmidium cellare TaxID=395010 RepID=A0ABR0E8L1_ZASCE|nr:hypothetical protein PRZ48_012026 [Zasmidium cellare]